MNQDAVVLVRMREPEIHQFIDAHRYPSGIADDVHRSLSNLMRIRVQ